MTLPPLDVPDLLRQYGLRPDKSLGQNFLVDPAGLGKVIAAAQVGPGDAVLEVGPGLGSLTRELAVRCRRVVAVELDANLIAPLRQVIAAYPTVEVVQGDILELDIGRLMAPPAGETPPAEAAAYRVVANIPYYITSALIRVLLEARQRPQSLTLTVQREVAERITAGPGEMSLLALSVQVYGQPRIAGRIPAGAFYPAPKVDSAVVQVDLYPQPALPPDHLEAFFRLAKAGFSQKRKTLRNALAGGMRWSPEAAQAFLLAAGIEPARRAETLALEEWGRLAAALPG